MNRHAIGHWALMIGAGGLLAVTYLFLYMPILHVALASVSSNTMWPYPPRWTTSAYTALFENRVYQGAFVNSLIIGAVTAVISTGLAGAAIFGLLRHPGPNRLRLVLIYVAPLFIADILLGISSLVFTSLFLGMGGNLFSAIGANAVRCFTYAFFIIAVQLYRYDWRLNDAAMVFGASPLRTFFEVTLPLAAPALFSAFLTTFILAFNNLEISFYLLGATPTLPSVAWGTLRYGLRPELYALTTAINVLVVIAFAIVLLLLRANRHRRMARVSAATSLA